MASDATEIEVDGPRGVRRMRVSSPDRVLWPEVGVTKLDVARYMVAVGEPFLAANGDRPVSLQRFKGDVTGEHFFSKNPPRGVPDFLRSTDVTYPSGRVHPQLVFDEPAALVWAVQMNTVVVHAWPSRTADTDRPDQIRLDLDPQPGTGLAEAIEVARVLRGVLEEAGLVPFVKTSGNRGLHVYAAIEPEHEFLNVRHAVIAAAREVERRLPDLATTAWWKEERGRRIFLDYNQAARDRTTAAAYSPRPTPLATVSCPVRWDELDGLDPTAFTVRSIPERLADGDAWAEMAGTAAPLAPLLERWRADVDAGLGELVFPPDYPKMPGEPPRVQPSRARAREE